VTNSIIKLMLIGDYSIFRSALRMLLETDRRLRVVGEAAQPETAADIISEERPDLIIVDMSDFGGQRLLPFVQQAKVPTLVMVSQLDVGIYQKCLSIGVKGLILKEESADMLFKAIEKIHNGEIWFDRTIMGETIRQLVVEKQFVQDSPSTENRAVLTDREKQVVELICKGMKNKGIAERLFITETTVRHHLTSVFSKLDISSRLELVIYAFRQNISTVTNGNGRRNGDGHKKLRAGFSVSKSVPAMNGRQLER
jgi:DNA-binding NarL/FixJ family response regulator